MHLLHFVLSFHEVIAKNDKHLEFSQKQSKYGSNIQSDKKRTNRKNNKKDKYTHSIEFSQEQSNCCSNRQKRQKWTNKQEDKKRTNRQKDKKWTNRQILGFPRSNQNIAQVGRKNNT